MHRELQVYSDRPLREFEMASSDGAGIRKGGWNR